MYFIWNKALCVSWYANFTEKGFVYDFMLEIVK